MKLNSRIWLVLAVTAGMLVAACTEQGGNGKEAVRAEARVAAPVARAGHARSVAFAALPDRGDLVVYDRNADTRRRGAYTWHPVNLSEEHALRAVASGEMRITAPNGRSVVLAHERHMEHPDGNWTWVGRTADGQEAVLTFGEHAAFGTIPNGSGLPLRLTMRSGRSWIVEVDRVRIANLDIAATRPKKSDVLLPPFNARLASAAASGKTMRAAGAASAATTMANDTVDVAIGYTPGFAAELGGQSQAVTRLNNLVEIANQAFSNSQLEGRIRLVRTLQVNYADATKNDTALEELTGYRDGNSIPVPAALQPLRDARESSGADLVSLVRSFRTPENEGCGIAWLLGFSQQPVDASWAEFGYSVVSDGADYDEAEDGNYFCRDETLAHELGHNLGSAHDRETAEDGDGVLDPDDYGRYPYSFGHKTTAGVGNFYTVMAYGDSGQTAYRIFSNPRTTYCGGLACGITDQVDNARSLQQMMPIIAQFRDTVLMPAESVVQDYNGDGRADVFWRHETTGSNVIWRSASSATQTSVTRVADVGWHVAATGDFNADGRWDVFWRHQANGKGAIWLSGSSTTQQPVTTVSNLAWEVVGTGDFNGDGRSDLAWRNYVTGGNAIWLSGNFSTQQAIASVTDIRWRVVGIGDFNADGRSDVMWRHSSNGRNTIWLSANGSTQMAVASVTDQKWQPVGVGDFNGDGRDDILWRHGSDGRNTIWLAGNGGVQQAVATVADVNWRVASVADFTGDGRADILWRHASKGSNVIWRSGSSSAQQTVASVTNLSWVVVH